MWVGGDLRAAGFAGRIEDNVIWISVNILCITNHRYGVGGDLRAAGIAGRLVDKAILIKGYIMFSESITTGLKKCYHTGKPG